MTSQLLAGVDAQREPVRLLQALFSYDTTRRDFGRFLRSMGKYS